MYIKPLKIGSLEIRNNLIQGPLAGYSCAPFRKLVQRFGAPAYCTTEMISAKDLAHKATKLKRYIWKDPAEGLLCYQLSGHEPNDMAKASQIVTEAGADLIDINCGCPVTKIRSKGAGSRLLAQPEKIAQLIEAIKQNTHLPVTVKIRIDSYSGDNNNLRVAKAVESAGADLLIVHGRHWSEKYDTPCNLQQIAEIVAHCNIPVIANGDVKDLESLSRTFLKTGCAGIMIARASVGKPWLFSQLQAESAAKPFVQPSLSQVGAVFIEHIQALAELETAYLAVLQARKLAKYYAGGLFESSLLQQTLNQCQNLAEVEAIIKVHFAI